ncbi:ribonuclease H-like domain-containing protein [Lysobacter panacisoli]|uniref:YprB ribonuclease H-like domain-containing protein n=1 Tax=Lysobacter panacisoli TaxID=1255263 RepID=A0ABP9LGL3_9GAMM|nr:ribonuclease H-like domain-containing protein [Lysobacter panacisoli]
MRLLTIDVETRPIESRHWGLWAQNIGINQIRDPGGLLCFAAKFHDERSVRFHSLWEDGEKAMARSLFRLFDEADAVAGWNSDKFDIRWIQAQFLKHGLSRPSPFAKVDLMKSVKKQVYLPSYKLDFVARWLGIGAKVRTGGFDLWNDVLDQCPKAYAKMRRYNINDTKLTEAVFDRLNAKGWVLGLPNASVEGGLCCVNPMCQSENLIRRGYGTSKTRKYQRWQCKDCGTFMSSTKSEPGSAALRQAA